jgi:hypothetical protein
MELSATEEFVSDSKRIHARGEMKFIMAGVLAGIGWYH